MAMNSEITGNLNEQQVMMLRLLKNPLPNDDFLKMRKLAVQLLAKKLDHVIEAHEEKNNLNEDDYDRLKNGHYRSKS